MDNVDVLNQMAEYDFNAPIDVTMIFEDSDEETSCNNVLKEQHENIRLDNKSISDGKVKSKRPPVRKKTIKNNINVNNSIDLNRNNTICERTIINFEEISANSDEIIIVECDNNLSYVGENLEASATAIVAADQQNKNETNLNQQSLIARTETEHNWQEVPEIHNQNNEPETTFTENLLHTLSKQLILIMQSFYHYGSKRNMCDPSAELDCLRRKKTFDFIKYHFFELSYSTVVALILPQEQNPNFIQNFIDNTVLLANNKPLSWKCERQHVQPFFNELIKWAKQKKAHHILSANSYRSSNENFYLKQHLSRPPQPFNMTYLKSASNSGAFPTPNAQNNVCIFASGPPGSEISININPDTLINCTEKQSTNNVQVNSNLNGCTSIAQSVSTYRPNAPPPYKSSHNSNINKSIHQRPPPPYKKPPKKNTIRKQDKNNNPNQNIVQPVQGYQNVGPVLPHQPQVNHVGINGSASESDFINSPHYNKTNYQMYQAQMLASRKCVRTAGRCVLCDKNTEVTCSKCNKPSYCSYLCQELDTQFNNSRCNST